MQTYTVEQMRTLEKMETLHFWSRSRRRLILDRLCTFARGRRALDVGCGTGLLVQELEERGFQAVGVDPQPSGFRSALRLLDAGAEKLPFGDASFDVVILADVLEHLEEEKPLAEAFRVLIPGGILLLTVPAFPWLWSERDEKAGHLRRYRPKELLAIADRWKGKVLYLGFYQCFLFPFFLLSRWFCSPHRETSLPRWVNHVFFKINLFELWLGKWIRWPWGSSIIAIIQKT